MINKNEIGINLSKDVDLFGKNILKLYQEISKKTNKWQGA